MPHGSLTSRPQPFRVRPGTRLCRHCPPSQPDLHRPHKPVQDDRSQQSGQMPSPATGRRRGAVPGPVASADYRRWIARQSRPEATSHPRRAWPCVLPRWGCGRAAGASLGPDHTDDHGHNEGNAQRPENITPDPERNEHDADNAADQCAQGPAARVGRTLL